MRQPNSPHRRMPGEAEFATQSSHGADGPIRRSDNNPAERAETRGSSEQQWVKRRRAELTAQILSLSRTLELHQIPPRHWLQLPEALCREGRPTAGWSCSLATLVDAPRPAGSNAPDRNGGPGMPI